MEPANVCFGSKAAIGPIARSVSFLEFLPSSRPSAYGDKVTPGVIEGTCFRARREKGWDT
jgi:hypothetical protein